MVSNKVKRKIGAGGDKVGGEMENQVQDGQALAAILQALGLKPSFAYEKFRTEWSDETGHVVVDETPIGDFGEIEGPPQWIDGVAKCLGISREQYITKSYVELFLQWKKNTRSKVSQMVFPL